MGQILQKCHIHQVTGTFHFLKNLTAGMNLGWAESKIMACVYLYLYV